MKVRKESINISVGFYKLSVSQDFEIRPRALLAIAVGFNQREDVDQIINKVG